MSVSICVLSPGYYSLRQQPGVPLDFRMDGPSEDLTAEAHPGRDHQAALRTAPRGPGHAGTHEEPAGGHHALPRGHRGSAHVDEAARYSLVVARTPA